MEFTLITLMSALGWKIVDTVKFAQNGNFKAVQTQVAAWVSGAVLVNLAAESDWAASTEINGVLMADMNVASRLLAGVAMLSVASVFKDVVGTAGLRGKLGTSTVRVAQQLSATAESAVDPSSAISRLQGSVDAASEAGAKVRTSSATLARRLHQEVDSRADAIAAYVATEAAKAVVAVDPKLNVEAASAMAAEVAHQLAGQVGVRAQARVSGRLGLK